MPETVADWRSTAKLGTRYSARRLHKPQGRFVLEPSRRCAPRPRHVVRRPEKSKKKNLERNKREPRNFRSESPGRAACRGWENSHSVASSSSAISTARDERQNNGDRLDREAPEKTKKSQRPQPPLTIPTEPEVGERLRTRPSPKSGPPRERYVPRKRQQQQEKKRRKRLKPQRVARP